jgi:hypothetical protein
MDRDTQYDTSTERQNEDAGQLAIKDAPEFLEAVRATETDDQLVNVVLNYSKCKFEGCGRYKLSRAGEYCVVHNEFNGSDDEIVSGNNSSFTDVGNQTNNIQEHPGMRLSLLLVACLQYCAHKQTSFVIVAAQYDNRDAHDELCETSDDKVTAHDTHPAETKSKFVYWTQ